ncbi:MAG: Gfo/Idh/MocA family protein [Puniceicoccaceae bacterium]
MQKRIGIGFIGAGANTRLRHLPGFAAIDGVELVSVANRSEASSWAVADAFGVGRVAPDWRAVIADPAVDAVCIGTWPYMHAEMTLAALDAGKHVLTEARMASSLEEARCMLEASEANPHLVAQIVPSPFTLDLDAAVRRLVDSGEVGELREVFIDHCTSAFVDPEAPLTWRQDPRYSGINMLTLGIYHEAVQRWITEDCEVERVAGEIFTRQRKHWESGETVDVDLPDSLHIYGRFSGGASLNYHFSGIEPGPGTNAVKLVGSNGTIRVEIEANEVLFCRNGDNCQPVEIPDEERRGWRVEEDFIDSIRNGTPVRLTNFADGVRYMEFTDAVHRKLNL